MRELIDGRNGGRPMRLLLALLLVMVASGSVSGLVKGKPVPPPEEIATKLNALVDKFRSDRAGFGCYTGEDNPDGLMCVLVLHCSMGMALIEGTAVRAIGVNFGGPGMPQTAGGPPCTTAYFLDQMASMVALSSDLPMSRACEIVRTMDRDTATFGSCHPDKYGHLPEGSGGIVRGQDNATYPAPDGKLVFGEDILKIFCWKRT